MPLFKIEIPVVVTQLESHDTINGSYVRSKEGVPENYRLLFEVESDNVARALDDISYLLQNSNRVELNDE